MTKPSTIMTLSLTIMLKRSNNMVSTYNDIFWTSNKLLFYSYIIVTTLSGMTNESNTMLFKSNIIIITQNSLPAASSIMASTATDVCIWSNKMLCWPNIIINARNNMSLAPVLWYLHLMSYKYDPIKYEIGPIKCFDQVKCLSNQSLYSLHWVLWRMHPTL